MKKSEILNVLNLVKPGIASKDIIESMTYFYLNKDKIVTYNDLISVQHPFDIQVKCFVKAKQFHDALTKIKEDELQISLNKGKLNIKAKGTNVNFATIKDKEIANRIKKVNKSLEDVKWKKLPEDFVTALMMCSFCTSKNESEGVATCVFVDGDKVKSTNNAQIAMTKLPKKIDNMFIKSSAIKDLKALEPIEYVITKSWIHFKNKDKCIFSIRTIKGKFPNIEKIFKKVKADSIPLPEEIKSGLDIASIFVDTDLPTVTVVCKDKKCIVRVESESGEATYEADMNYKGKEVKFKIQPAFLLQMLEHDTNIKVNKSIAMIESENFKIATALII